MASDRVGLISDLGHARISNPEKRSSGAFASLAGAGIGCLDATLYPDKISIPAT